MTQPAKYAFVGLGLVLLYSLFRKGSGLQSLQFYPAAVQKITLEGMTPVLTIGLGVQNTSNQDFKLNSIAGNAYANNTYLGNISSFQPISIKRNSEQIVPLNFRLQFSGVVSNIVDAINSGSFNQALRLDLMANVDGLQVPIKFDITVGP